MAMLAQGARKATKPGGESYRATAAAMPAFRAGRAARDSIMAIELR
jgi:hypothetical protein